MKEQTFPLHRSCWYRTEKDVLDAITVCQTITESIHQSHDGWTEEEVKTIEAFLKDIAVGCASWPWTEEAYQQYKQIQKTWKEE